MLPNAQYVNSQATLAVASLKPHVDDEDKYPIVGSSSALRAALERARQAARSDADILLEAESGTGKELLARLIHKQSRRAG